MSDTIIAFKNIFVSNSEKDPETFGKLERATSQGRCNSFLNSKDEREFKRVTCQQVTNINTTLILHISRYRFFPKPKS